MFARVEDDGTTMTVRHEEIPGYMAAMTMPFKVGEASLLDGLEYGDKIQFELVVDKEGSVVYAYEGVPLVVTYHPAALLRNAGWTRSTWDDFQLLRKVLDGS